MNDRSTRSCVLKLPVRWLLCRIAALALLLSSSAAVALPLHDLPVVEVSGVGSAPVTVLKTVGISNLRAEVYSRTAAELFWDRVAGGPLVVAHRVYMADKLVSSRDGYSLFVNQLQPGQRYSFTVEAVGADGTVLASDAIVVETPGSGNSNGDSTSAANPPAANPPQSGDHKPAPEPSGNLAEPRNFRVTVYSRTVAELFWDASPDEPRVHYELYLNGDFALSTRGRSLFIPRFDPDRQYKYVLYNVDSTGRRSNPASLVLGVPESESDSEPVEDAVDGPVDEPATPLEPADDETQDQDAHFTASLRSGDRTLVEGGPELLLPVSIIRHKGHDRPVNLSLEAGSAGALDSLAYHFEPGLVATGINESVLHMRLAVAMAPLMPAERTLVIVASDGVSTKRVAVELAVTPVDAPDVYLLAGQSNMTGSSQRNSKQAGSGEPDAPHERVLQLNVVQNNLAVYPKPSDFVSEDANVSSPLMIPAEDPLHQPRWPRQLKKGGTSVGLGLSFAKSILGRTSQNIVLVPAAWSGAGFCDNGAGAVAWNAYESGNPALGGSLLVDRALTRLNLALRSSGGIFRGILWHQGEADSNNPQCAASYSDNLVKLVKRIRREARRDRRGAQARGADAPVPFIVGTMSRGGEFAWFGPIKGQVDETHRRISALLPWSEFVNNDDLVPPAYPCGSSSCVHFGARALREMGARYGEALRRIVNR